MMKYLKSSPAPTLCLTRSTCHILYSRIPRIRSSPNTSI